MTFPTPYVIGHRRYVEGDENARGNPRKSWTEPVDVRIIGYYRSTSSEPVESGRDEVVDELTVLAPPSFYPGPHDKLVIDGDEYDVHGHPADYNHGPYGFHPGNAISARRVEG